MDDNRTDIQTKKSVPPWERPGCFRLDCEPHRGMLLRWMGRASLIIGCISFIPLPFPIPVVGLPFCLTT
jgi:hypothetical protein